PTRELAAQVAESARDYGRHTGLRTVVIFGGVSEKPQIEALRTGCDLLVATPGRLLDLAQQQLLDLRQVRCCVLDEADRMLDMGFIHDIRRILKLLPGERQNLMFSATYSEDIRELAGRLLRNPVAIEVAARSLDIQELPHVVNYELPNVPEYYVHRIGRTARAGGSGSAVSLVSPDEAPLLRDIEKLLRRTLPVAALPAYPVTAAPAAGAPPARVAALAGAHRHEGRRWQAGPGRRPLSRGR